MEGVIHCLDEQDPAAAARARRRYECLHRTMFSDSAASWNLRDRHTADTLDQLAAHLDRHENTSRIVVWEHNSHIGDARSTAMAGRGELNLGQLMRERHSRDAVLVGLTTYTGTVSAASQWGHPVERKRVRPALSDSFEALFHATGIPALLLCPLGASRFGQALSEPRLERAIGVITANRASEPLVRRRHRPPVRRGDLHRRHPRRRAARTHPRLDARRATRDLSERALMQAPRGGFDHAGDTSRANPRLRGPRRRRPRQRPGDWRPPTSHAGDGTGQSVTRAPASRGVQILLRRCVRWQR